MTVGLPFTGHREKLLYGLGILITGYNALISLFCGGWICTISCSYGRINFPIDILALNTVS